MAAVSEEKAVGSLMMGVMEEKMEEIVVGTPMIEMGIIVVEGKVEVTAGMEEMQTMVETVETEVVMFKEALAEKVIVREVENVNIRALEEAAAMRYALIGKVVIVVEEKAVNFHMKTVEVTSKAVEVENFAKMLVTVTETVETFPAVVVLGKENALIFKKEAVGGVTVAGFPMKKRILKQMGGSMTRDVVVTMVAPTKEKEE